jgi:hypothetical protein
LSTGVVGGSTTIATGSLSTNVVAGPTTIANGILSTAAPAIQTSSAITLTTTTSTTTTTTVATNPCASVTCGTNAQCISTTATGYCACLSGYYGDANAGGNCKRDTGNSQIVMPYAVTFPIDFVSALLDSHSEAFRKAKLSIEAILLKAFILVLKQTPTAVEVISFSSGSTIANYLTIIPTSSTFSSVNSILAKVSDTDIVNAITSLTKTSDGKCNITGVLVDCSQIYSKLSTSFDYCSGVQCPTGGNCTNLYSNYTYSCTCIDGYSVSGTLSSSSPLLQSCTPNYSMATVVIAVVIPVACGIVIILLGIFFFFVMRHRYLSNKELSEAELVDELNFEVEVLGENVQHYRN